MRYAPTVLQIPISLLMEIVLVLDRASVVQMVMPLRQVREVATTLTIARPTLA